jgi:hypothetical protein
MESEEGQSIGNAEGWDDEGSGEGTSVVAGVDRNKVTVDRGVGVGSNVGHFSEKVNWQADTSLRAPRKVCKAKLYIQTIPRGQLTLTITPLKGL